MGPVAADAVESGIVSAAQVGTEESVRPQWIECVRTVLANYQKEVSLLFTYCTEDNASDFWTQILGG